MTPLLKRGQRAFAALQRAATVFAIGNGRDELARQLRRAQMAARERRFGEAARAYRRALEIDARCTEAHAGLSRSHLQLGEPDAALAAARAYVEVAPRRPSARRFLGQALFRLDRIDEAARAFEALRAIAPDDQVAALHLARIALRKSEPDKALAELTRLRGEGRHALQRHLVSGDALMQLGRAAEARGEYEAARLLQPGRVETLLLLANAHRQLGPSEEAERIFAELHRMRPSDVGVGILLARALLKRAEYGEAESVLGRLLRAAPDSKEALALWADTLAARSERRRSQAIGSTSERLRREALAEARAFTSAVAAKRAVDPDVAALARMEALASGTKPLSIRPRDLERDISAILRRETLAQARFSAGRPNSPENGAEREPAMISLSTLDELLASARTDSAANQEGSSSWIADQTAQAIFASRTGAWKDVIEIADRVLEREPANVTILELAGFAANRAAVWSAAARFWGALSTIQKERRGPKLQHVNALVEGGRLSEASQRVDLLLRQDPRALDLIRLKFNVLARDRNMDGLASFDAELRQRTWTRSDAALLEAIGAGFIAADDQPAARHWLEEARRVDPAHTGALRLQARVAYNERRYDVAVQFCEELDRVGNDGQKTEARLILARIAHLQGAASLALAHYRSAVAVAPDNVEATTYLLRWHLARRQIAEAEEYVAGFRGGDGGTLHWWRALVLQARGDAARAVAELLEALAASPDNRPFRERVIEFLMESGEFDPALQVIRDGLVRQPGSARLRGRLLQCRLRMNGPAEEIVDICTETLALHPHDEDALLQRSNSLTRLGRRREAIADFRLGLSLFPRNTTFWRSAVSSLLLVGEEAAAAQLLDEARAAFCERSAADLTALAEIFEAADLQEQSVQVAQAAVALEANVPHARMILARIEMQRGCIDRAWPHLRDLQDVERPHIRTTRLYAQAAAARLAGATGDDERRRSERDFPAAMFDEIVRRCAGQRAARDDGPSDPAALRVMHVTSTLGPGGAERQLTNTVVQLAGAAGAGGGVELVVEDLNAAHGRDFFLPAIRSGGVPVHCLEDERRAGNWRDMLAERPDMRFAVQAIASLPAEVVRNALCLLPILLRQRPHVVHLWQDSVCIAGGLAAVIAGVPRIVLSTRSTRPVERQRARRYLEPGFHALLGCAGVTLINNSQYGARDYESWLGLPARSIEVVHNGYDFDAIRARRDPARSSAIRAELGIPDSAPVLGGVMRCSFEKRPELWTEVAIALCRASADCHAVLVGDGPMLADIKGRVGECGLAGRIHFVGIQSPVEPWMDMMNVLFLSSLTEGLPNVLIEAQSLGVPVATMRVGGAPETVLGDETGIVLDEGTPSVIARQIQALLEDADRRAAFGQRAVEWTTSRFSIRSVAEALRTMYRRADPNATGQEASAR